MGRVWVLIGSCGQELNRTYGISTSGDGAPQKKPHSWVNPDGFLFGNDQNRMLRDSVTVTNIDQPRFNCR